MSAHKPTRHADNRQRGFTLMETLAAIIVLSIGLLGMAALMSNMMTGGARSRYMSEAAMLASEKLEDLERYPAADANVAVTSGTIAGSLSSDITATVTSNGSTDSVDYFDTIQLSATGGNIGRIQNQIKNIGATTRNVYFDRRFAQNNFAPPWFPSTSVQTSNSSSATLTTTIQRTNWFNRTTY